MTSLDTLRPQLDRLGRIALAMGAIGIALCSLFSFGNREQVFHSYLLAYVFWLAIPLGCMSILMLHHLTGGWWGYPIRRLLEAGTRTFPVMALVYVPILLGMKYLYSWARPADVAADAMLQYKHPYLNPQFFTVRAVIYFAIWLMLAYFLNKWSRDQDRTGEARLAGLMEGISGPGLILWGIAVTYSSIDWVMSLEPHWFSTIYGMIFMIVESLVAMAFVILVVRIISAHVPPLPGVTPGQFNDLGNLMLAFVMLWAYLSFSQFLIIWAGNIKDEIPWYMARAFGGWGQLAAFLIATHFAIPFLLLLQRGVKRRLRVLSWVAAMMIVLSLVDVYWLVVPAYQSGPWVHPLDVFAVIGIGGIFVGTFIWQLKKMPLLPLHDPRFEGAHETQYEHGD